jgi:uncharacterized membrane protein
MTRNDFLAQLKVQLRRLPPEEIDNAMSYYEEYFNEAGPENEQKVLAELGSPAAVASKIIGEYAVNDLVPKAPVQKKSPQVHPIIIVLLAILASPIALPIAFALVVSVAAVIFALGAVFFSLGVSSVAVAIYGIFMFFSGFAALFQSFGTGLFFIGYGLLCIAVGIALAVGIFNLCKVSVSALQKALGNYLIRKGAQKT